ncbi:MAG: hypothetical protein Q9217_002135 [Psora testacea]
MLQPPSPDLSGPRASRQSARLTSSRQPNRGGIRKPTATPYRVDKDGDLVMDAAGAGVRGERVGTRGRGSAIHGSRQTRRHNTPDSVSSRMSTRPARTGIDMSAIQKAVLRGMGSNEPLPKGLRTGLKGVHAKENTLEVRNGLDKIRVWGLKESKAAVNKDGGISDLIAFLERKATNPDAPARDAVKIKKSHMEGDTLIIFVRPEDTPKILRINHFTFAGASLKIERPSEKPTSLSKDASSETPNTIETLKDVLSRRYNAEARLLDLSQLGDDPGLVNIGMFNATSTESKFFPALMKVCDGIFTSSQEKEEAVASVSLANNALTDVSSVTTLSQTFPAIKNLDLSNNQIPHLKALGGWRWRFRKLEHLILSGNPIEVKEPNYKAEITKWYPTLTTLNTLQIRSPEEVTTFTRSKLPLPILGPSFRDEASIAENFVKQFFPGYDTDRIALVNGYYDAQSTFSLSVNTSAPRGELEVSSYQAASWDQYIKRSRNLMRVTHVPARMSRLYTGTEMIKDCFTVLPATRHPDLLSEPQKWCIECHTLPGLPDPSRQSVSGVGGLMVIVHGEFSEVDISTNKTTVTRSFDRTFILGPGGGIGGIRVACDTLVLRAYGGFGAWEPEDVGAPDVPAAPSQASQYQIPIPEGFGVAGTGKTEEQVEKEMLALKLSNTTGMTLEYSGMCLEQSGWNLEGAGIAFEQAKVNLPAEAFLP